MSIDETIEQMIDRKVEQRLVSLPAPHPSAATAHPSVDEETRKQIAQYELVAHKTYLNKKETALYLGCSERSIEEWAARSVSENPLPVGYAGSDMRNKREKVDQWVDREAQRKRLKLAS